MRDFVAVAIEAMTVTVVGVGGVVDISTVNIIEEKILMFHSFHSPWSFK